MAPKKRGGSGGSKSTTKKKPPARAAESDDDGDDMEEEKECLSEGLRGPQQASIRSASENIGILAPGGSVN